VRAQCHAGLPWRLPSCRPADPQHRLLPSVVTKITPAHPARPGQITRADRISDIHGISGRDVLRAIIAGERDPEVLAQKARTRMRRKIAQLREALDCSFFTGDHAFVLQIKLDNIDHNTAQIAVLDERIAVLSEPYERQVARLVGLPLSASPTGSSTSASSVRAASRAM
jgi:hypothetical protein